MRFSSLACLVHDWIHSPTRAFINKTQKIQCEGIISLLAAKLQNEPESVPRARVVERLRKDLQGMMTCAEAAKTKFSKKLSYTPSIKAQ